MNKKSETYYIIHFKGAGPIQTIDLKKLNRIFDSHSTRKDAEEEIERKCQAYGFTREDYSILEVNTEIKEIV